MIRSDLSRGPAVTQSNSGHPPISVEASRNVRPEHSKGEPGGKHIQTVQLRRACLPGYAVDHDENDDDADPISGKRAHFRSLFFLSPARGSIIDVFSKLQRNTSAAAALDSFAEAAANNACVAGPAFPVSMVFGTATPSTKPMT
jgi:hypothetical protein